MSGLLDDLLDDQRRRWDRGEGWPVERYLADHPALAADDEGVVDLIYHEFVLRAARGEPPPPEDLFRRFPRHRAALQAQLAFLGAAQALAGRLTLTAGPAPHTCVPDPTPGAARRGPAGDGWPCVEGYEVLGELGRGSTGVVYRARQDGLGRLVAVKVLHAFRAGDPQARARFRGEAEAVACLHHPNIVQVHAVGECDGRPYLVMELVEGLTLARRLADGPLPARQAARLVEALARAVHHAHGCGVIHRDLKPANILLASGGREPPDSSISCVAASGGSRPPLAECIPYITDFGLAKQRDEARGHLTETGAVLGTPSYMAPEQAAGRGRQVGPAADVYALGALLHEALTGRPPFLADTPLATLHRVVSEEPIAPSRLQPGVPRDLDTVCLKCLEKAPRRRYASALDLAEDLARYLRDEPIAARPAGAGERLGRWCRRKPVVASLTGALLLAVAVGLGGTAYHLRQVEAGRREAEAARAEAEASDAQVQQLLNEVLQPGPNWLAPVHFSRRMPHIDALLRAEAHFERLLRKKPGELRVRIALTNVRGSLGTLYDLRGQVAETEACYQGARDLWEGLARAHPGNAEYRDWLATTCHWQALAASARGLDWRWLGFDLQVLALSQELAEEQPDNLAVQERVARIRVELLSMRNLTSAGDALLRPLEEERARLGKGVDEAPADAALRQRLALTCLVLGELHHGRGAAPEAVACWRQAHEHYRRLAEARPHGPLVELNLAYCCSRLMAGRPPDAYYAEAVARFEEAGDRLAAIARQHPDSVWPRQALVEAYSLLAVCHWRAGETARAERMFQEKVRPLAGLASEYPADQSQGFRLLSTLLAAADPLREANHPAALRFAREAAASASRYADVPSRDLEFCEELAVYSTNISALLSQLDCPAEALPLAEQARRLYAGLGRAAPDVLRYRHGLSAAWERTAKAEWKLGRADAALAAFRQAAAAERQVFERAPTVPVHRMTLSRCYDRLALWGGLAGDQATAAAALLEREKLWPGDPEQLLEVSRDFRRLANAVGGGRGPLLPREEDERQRYLTESERTRRAADAVRHPASDGEQR